MAQVRDERAEHTTYRLGDEFLENFSAKGLARLLSSVEDKCTVTTKFRNGEVILAGPVDQIERAKTQWPSPGEKSRPDHGCQLYQQSPSGSNSRPPVVNEKGRERHAMPVVGQHLGGYQSPVVAASQKKAWESVNTTGGPHGKPLQKYASSWDIVDSETPRTKTSTLTVRLTRDNQQKFHRSCSALKLQADKESAAEAKDNNKSQVAEASFHVAPPAVIRKAVSVLNLFPGAHIQTPQRQISTASLNVSSPTESYGSENVPDFFPTATKQHASRDDSSAASAMERGNTSHFPSGRDSRDGNCGEQALPAAPMSPSDIAGRPDLSDGSCMTRTGNSPQPSNPQPVLETSPSINNSLLCEIQPESQLPCLATFSANHAASSGNHATSSDSNEASPGNHVTSGNPAVSSGSPVASPSNHTASPGNHTASPATPQLPMATSQLPMTTPQLPLATTQLPMANPAASSANHTASYGNQTAFPGNPTASYGNHAASYGSLAAFPGINPASSGNYVASSPISASNGQSCATSQLNAVTKSCLICKDIPRAGQQVTLPCNHSFCRECITNSRKIREICPVCDRQLAKVVGGQPKNGDISHQKIGDVRIAGYEDHKTIVIKYSFTPGVQKAKTGDRNPGREYKATSGLAFLPDNKQGQNILKLMHKAFKRKTLFAIYGSQEQADDVMWTVDPKVSTTGGGRFGYPDEMYLMRVKDQLSAN